MAYDAACGRRDDARPQSAQSKAPKSKLVLLVGVATAAIVTPLVGQWEGKRNDPYRDIVGVWTVCGGETRVPMRHYSDAECAAMLEDGLADFAGAVLKRNPTLRERPYQLAAATSLAYNIGAPAYGKSTAAKRFAAGDYPGACEAMTRYTYAGGKFIQGLKNRRQAEYRICMTDLK